MHSLVTFLCTSVNLYSKTSILSVVAVFLFWKFLAPDRRKLLLSKIPGPKGYPIIGNLLDVLVPREQLFRDNVERCRKYGKIYKFWLGNQPSVSLSDPEYVEEILHSSKHLKKGFAYKFIEPFLGSGLITSHGNKWSSHRKILTPAFHFKILDSFLDVFREQGKAFIEKLDEKAKEAKAFDIYGYVKHCALDVICEAAMGVKVDAQSNTHSQYVQSVLRISTLFIERVRKLWLHPDIIYKMTESGKENERHLKVAHGFVENVIQQRKKLLEEQKINGEVEDDDKIGKKTRRAFLDLLLATAASEKVDLSDKDIREEVDTFMFAGHDTTTSAITWAIHLLGLHPKVQEQLYQEQKSIFGDEMERPITQNDLTKMNVLDRVMKECIRLYPSVPVISRVLDEDVRFGEYLVPKGTTANLHIYCLHRNPATYPEPNKFDPDRFLPENVDKRHSYAYIPFSAGPRNCIGKRFALLEEKFMLASLIRRYEIESVEKPQDLDLIGELVLRPLSGVKVILKRRNEI